MIDGGSELIPFLHDATLIAVRINWREGLLLVSLATGMEPTRVDLVATGFAYFECPRRQEWGPSVSINDVNVFDGELAGRTIVQIEMQSGDVIKFEAERIVLSAVVDPAYRAI